MPIVYLAIIIAAYAAALLAYPRLRVAGGIVGALVVSGLVLYLVVIDPTDRVQENRIAVGDVRLQGLSLDDNGRSYVLSGRIENLSESYVLRDFRLRVRLYDCPDAGSDFDSCQTVGDDEGIARASVPPGQVREFSAIFYYPSLPEMRGKMRWQEDVLSVRATERRS